MTPMKHNSEVSEKAKRVHGSSPRLLDQVKAWMSPRSHEAGNYQYSKGDKSKPVPTLTGQSKLWVTPNRAGGGNPPELLTPHKGHFLRPSGHKAHLALDQQASMWATPKKSEVERGVCPSELARNTASLLVQAHNWPTPRKEYDSGQGSKGDASLHSAAKSWPTPTKRDHKGSANLETRYREMGTLDEAAEQKFPGIRPAPTTSTDGEPCSTSRLGSRQRLNPAFVGWLMGYPFPWIRAVLRCSVSWATPSTRKPFTPSSPRSLKSKGTK